MKFHLKISFVAVLGALLLLGACSKMEPVLNPNSEIRRELTIDSEFMKQQMKYNLYLPPKYNPNAAYPILYLLHGANGDQNSWLDNGNAQQIADDYIILQEGTPMIIVMPEALLTRYIGDFENYFHEELMPAVEGAYKFNGKRALAGLSMGGYGTLYHALKYPEKFTYGYAMSPSISGWFTEFIDARADKSVFPPFTFEVGEQDTIVDNKASKAIADYMISNGLDVEWISREGRHNWTFWPDCLSKALIVIGKSF